MCRRFLIPNSWALSLKLFRNSLSSLTSLIYLSFLCNVKRYCLHFSPQSFSEELWSSAGSWTCSAYIRFWFRSQSGKENQQYRLTFFLKVIQSCASSSNAVPSGPSKQSKTDMSLPGGKSPCSRRDTIHFGNNIATTGVVRMVVNNAIIIIIVNCVTVNMLRLRPTLRTMIAISPLVLIRNPTVTLSLIVRFVVK